MIKKIVLKSISTIDLNPSSIKSNLYTIPNPCVMKAITTCPIKIMLSSFSIILVAENTDILIDKERMIALYLNNHFDIGPEEFSLVS